MMRNTLRNQIRLSNYRRFSMVGALGMSVSLTTGAALADESICVASGGELANPGQVIGALEASDTSEGPNYGAYHDAYTLAVVAGEPVVISMNAGFDGMLFIEDEDCNILAMNDDANDSLNPEVLFQPELTGEVSVVATSYDVGVEGDYEITAVPYTPPDLCVEATGSLEVPDSVEGELSAEDDSDGPAGENHYSDGYQLMLYAGESVAMSVTSSAFDAMMFLTTQDCEIIAFNDDFNGLDPLIEFTASADGMVNVIVTSYNTGAIGDYTLAVWPFEPAAPILSDTLAVNSGRVRMFDHVFGALTRQDAVNSNRYYDAYGLFLSKGQRAEIEMPSASFDTYLVVQDAAGNEIARNDDYDGVNARVVFDADYTGRFTVIASSFSEGARGRYELIIGKPVLGALNQRFLSKGEARALIRKGARAEKVLHRTIAR